MKRTIKVRVEVADAEEYAEVVAAIVGQPAVIESVWTRGEEINSILAEKHGLSAKFDDGAIDEILSDER